MPNQLGPGDAGQDAVDHHPVRPGRVQSLHVEQVRVAQVDAPELGGADLSLVEVPVQRDQRGPARAVDRSVHDRDQVEVTDTRHIIAGRQRPRHQQVPDQSELGQPLPELHHRGRLHGHGRQARCASPLRYNSALGVPQEVRLTAQ